MKGMKGMGNSTEMDTGKECIIKEVNNNNCSGKVKSEMQVKQGNDMEKATNKD